MLDNQTFFSPFGRILTSSFLVALLAFGPGVSEPSHAWHSPADADFWHQYSKVDPADAPTKVELVWDLKQIAVMLDSYAGRVIIKIITHQDTSEVVPQGGPYFVVNFDLDNDQNADISVSSIGSSSGNTGLTEIEQSVLNPKYSNNCRFWGNNSRPLDKKFSNDKKGDFKDEERSVAAVGYEQWRWSGLADRMMPCGLKLGKTLGVQVQTWSNGQVVDQIPNSNTFVKFSGRYNDGWKCGPALNGLIRENVPHGVAPKFLPKSFTRLSYCGLRNGSWVWLDTKPKPVVIVPGKPSRKP